MTCVWELEMTGDLHCFTTQQRNRVLSSRHKQCYSLDVCKWQMVAWVQDADDMRRLLNKAKDKSRKTYIHEKSQKNATWFVEISPLTREHYTFFILHYFLSHFNLWCFCWRTDCCWFSGDLITKHVTCTILWRM